MLRKFLMIFLTIFISISAIAQTGTKIFVSVKIDNHNKTLESYDLPIYHLSQNYLLTEINKEQLESFRKQGLEVKVIDSSINSDNYLIFDKKNPDLIVSENAIEYDDFLIDKRIDENDFTSIVPSVEVKKTPFIYRSEKEHIFTSQKENLSNVIQDVVNEVNQDSVRYFIQSLQDFGTRHWENVNRKEVALWIKNQFLKFGIENARLDSFQYLGTWQYNVVAEISGRSDSEEVIVIGAHHDSITNDNYANPNSPAPGADDNASGTAAVLEIARTIMTSGYIPEKTIIFNTYAAEERGLHGSHYLAEKARQNGTKIKLMINHDMISNTDRPLSESRVYVNYYYASDAYRDMAVENLETYTPVTPVYGSPSSASDSYSYFREGYPAIYFAEYDFSSWYHSTDDVISNYSMEYCAEVIKASAATAITVAEFPSSLEYFTVYDLGTGNSLLLEWEKSKETDLGNYKISLGTSEGIYDQFFYTTDTTFILDELVEGEKYFIGISVIDADGNESPILEKSLTPFSKPLAPTAAVAEPGWFEIELSWNKNKEVDLEGYNIYRSKNDTLNFQKLNNSVVTDTNFVDDSSESGSYYFYHIAAVDNDGNESDKEIYLKSRAVTMDKGILLVDETENGDGSELSPTDNDVDGFYAELLSGFSYDVIDTDKNEGINLADLGPYKTLIWYGDDNNDFRFTESAKLYLREYLDYGGNIIYSGFKPSRAFANNTSSSADFTNGDFIFDYLKIQSSEYFLFSRFYGAIAENGEYSDIYVDTTKTSSSIDFHLRGIESLTPTVDGEIIYKFYSDYDSTSNYAKHNNRPVGIKYKSEDYNSVVLTFPLYYMEEEGAKEFLENTLTEFGEVVSVKEKNSNVVPEEFILHQNYPNPFNPSTTIKFSLPENSFVTLKIYDVLGREVATLINENLEAGVYDKTFNAGKLSSGVYIYSIRSTDFSESRKMILLK